MQQYPVWLDPKNYKNCAKKSYDIHVCMPPRDTIVINKLEQADVVKMFNGKTYFTVDDIKSLSMKRHPILSQLQQLKLEGRIYMVSSKEPFVLCGTVGEMWLINPDKLAMSYTFIDGGKQVAINQQSLDLRSKNGLLKWTAVKVSKQATVGQNMACFVPVSMKGHICTSYGSVLSINGEGVSHGKGDFVVCSKLPNNQPNMQDCWVVNGNVFATTYNNQGWTDCLDLKSSHSAVGVELPKLF